MKKLLVAVVVLCCAVGAFAQNAPELNGHRNNTNVGWARPGGGGGQGLVDHGGPVMVAPKVVCIFWGFGNGNSYTAAMQSFRTSGMYNYNRMLSQYRSAGASASTDMGGSANDKFDTSTPPANVTDSLVQAEVKKYFGGAEDTSTIYQVYIPSSSYSSDGTSTSCGGPSLAYCAYHGNFATAGGDTKYGSMPYPSCGGCQSSGFSTVQNIEHFISHETREAVTDPDGTGWYDRRG